MFYFLKYFFDNKNLSFKILNTGIKADIEFSDTNSESENNGKTVPQPEATLSRWR